MNATNIVGLVLAIAVTVFLVIALIFPGELLMTARVTSARQNER